MSEQHEQVLRDFSQLDRSSPFEDFVAYAQAVSEAFRRPDGTLIAPKGRHFDAAAELGWGVDRYAIGKVIGGLLPLQEALGFVMPETARRWSDEQFLENGRWISHMAGSAAEPVPPLDPLVNAFAQLNLAPSRHLIRNRFGNWDVYLEKLGYVSPLNTDRWTDQDWIDNGVWLSHMLGSPDNPAQLTKGILQAAAKARIIPPVDRIVQQYGSLTAYYQALGLAPTFPKLDCKGWDRDRFTQNGIWFSHALGTPEHPKMPTADDMEAGFVLGLCPSRHVVMRVFDGSFLNYQDALGFVTRAALDRWTDQDWIDNGVWLSHMLGSAEEPVMPGRRELGEGKNLGVSPSVGDVVGRFGSLTAYQEALGFHAKRRYNYWTDRQYLQHGLKVITSLHGQRIPTIADYDTTPGPGRRPIESRFDTLAAFHERLGIPAYTRWSAEQLVNFGVQWAAGHGNRPPTEDELAKLAANGKGPLAATLCRRFGTVAAFQTAVEAVLPSYTELVKHLSARWPSIGVPMVRHLLRDFRQDNNYAEQRTKVAALLHTFHKTDAVDIYLLRKWFADSRLTLHWEEPQFVSFGRVAVGDRNQSVMQCKRKLAVLDAAGLAPYPQDIADVFGNLDRFIVQALDSS